MRVTRLAVYAGIVGVVLLGLGVGLGYVGASDDPSQTSGGDPVEIRECTVVDSPGEYVIVDDIEADEDTCIEVRNTQGVVIDGAGHTISGYLHRGVLVSDSSNVEVRDVGIAGARWQAVTVYQSETVRLHDNRIEYTDDTEVFIDASTDLIVTGNQLENTDKNGFGIRFSNSTDGFVSDNEVRGSWGGVNTWGSANITIVENTIDGVVYGIQGRDYSTDLVVRDNVIMNSVLCAMDFKTGSSAILVEDNYVENAIGIQLEQNTTNVTIRDNTLIDTRDGGIQLFNHNNNALIQNNTVVNDDSHAITVSTGYDIEIRDNTAINPEYSGIQIHHDTSNVTAWGNLVRDTGTSGISVWQADRATITANEIRNAGQDGILVEHSNDTTIEDIQITGAARDGIRLADSRNTTVRDVTIRDEAGWVVTVTYHSGVSTFERVDIGQSTQSNTTVSFDATDLHLGRLTDPPDHPDRESIGRYFTAHPSGPNPTLSVALHYTEEDTEHVDEDTLRLWRVNDDEWHQIDSDATPTQHVVSASITEFGVFGGFGDPHDPEPVAGEPDDDETGDVVGVDDDQRDDVGDDDLPPVEQPGFQLIAALIALLVAALIVSRLPP